MSLFGHFLTYLFFVLSSLPFPPSIESLESVNQDMIKKVNKSVRLTIKKNRPRRFSSPNAVDIPDKKAAGSSRKVAHCLVASTNPVVRRALQTSLQNTGILSSCVQNGVEALRLARDRKAFDTIFLEIGMPDLSGLEVAHMIRLPSVQIIALMKKMSNPTSKLLFCFQTRGIPKPAHQDHSVHHHGGRQRGLRSRSNGGLPPISLGQIRSEGRDRTG